MPAYSMGMGLRLGLGVALANAALVLAAGGKGQGATNKPGHRFTASGFSPTISHKPAHFMKTASQRRFGLQ